MIRARSGPPWSTTSNLSSRAGEPVGQRGVRALESSLDHRGLAPWVEGPRGVVRQSPPESVMFASHLPVPSARAGFLNTAEVGDQLGAQQVS